MTDNVGLKLYMGISPIEIPWAEPAKRHVFISDLHLNPLIREHVQLLSAIYRLFPTDVLLWGGDTFRFELLPRSLLVTQDIEIIHTFAHLVGDSLEKTVIIPGNHDPFLIFYPLLKRFERGSEKTLHTSVHTKSPSGKSVFYSHGHQFDPLAAITSLPFIQRAVSPLGRTLDDRLEDPHVGKPLTAVPRGIQKAVTVLATPPDSNSVVGHSHFPTVVDLSGNRHLYISGSSHGDSLNGDQGSFSFWAVINNGTEILHHHLRYDAPLEDIREIVEV